MRRTTLLISALALLTMSGFFLASEPPVKERKLPHETHRRVLSTVTFDAKGPSDHSSSPVDPNPSFVYFTSHSLDGDPVYGADGTQSKMNNFATFRFTVVGGSNGPTLKTGRGMYHFQQKGICHDFGKYLGVMHAAPPADAPYYVFEEKNDPKVHWAFEATPNDPDFCTIFWQKGPNAPIELFQVAIRRPLVEQ